MSACIGRPRCLFAFIVLLVVFLLSSFAHAQTAVLRVDGANGTLPIPPLSTGQATGIGWGPLAFKNLQDAIEQANILLNQTQPPPPASVEIWVAATASSNPYRPDRSRFTPNGTCGLPGGCDRTLSFSPASKMVLLGGFVGNETAPSQRDPVANVTVLSGDLLVNDGPAAFQNNTENSWHIVRRGVTLADPGPATVLDGFTLTGGNANGGATVDSFDRFGGAILLEGQGVTAPVRMRVLDCILVENRAQGGGGAIYSYSTGVVARKCEFLRNRAQGGNTGGGAIGIYEGPPPALVTVDCLFDGNESTSFLADGGAIYGATSPILVVSSVFRNNTCNRNGGAIYAVTAHVMNGLFHDNDAFDKGGAMELFLGGQIVNTTVVRNDAHSVGGIHVDFRLPLEKLLANSILYFNTDSDPLTNLRQEQLEELPPNVTFLHNNVQGLTPIPPSVALPGVNNVNDDPQFLSAGTNDFHLAPCSPSRDAGDNGAIPVDDGDVDDDFDLAEKTPWDLDKLPRRFPIDVSGIVDMGVYEKQEFCAADLDGDNDVDGVDLGIMLLNWSTSPSMPGCGGAIPCLADINCDGHVDGIDLGILLNSFTVGGENPCPDGESFMMGGGSGGEETMSSAGTAIGQLALTPELVEWLVNAEIGELWAWYQLAFGGSPGEQ